MLTKLQSVEVETVRRRDHQLAVEHDLGRQLFEQRFTELREVAHERLLIPALEIEVVAVAEQDAPEAVPLRLVQQIGCRRHVSRQLREHRLERRSNGQGHEPKLVEESRRATRRSRHSEANPTVVASRRQSRRRSLAQRASWWRLDSWSLRRTDET